MQWYVVIHVFGVFLKFFYISCRCFTIRPCRNLYFLPKNLAKNYFMAKLLQPGRFCHIIQQSCKYCMSKKFEKKNCWALSTEMGSISNSSFSELNPEGEDE